MRFSVRESIQVLIRNVSIAVSISMLFIQPSLAHCIGGELKAEAYW
jgi:hypothetical protein